MYLISTFILVLKAEFIKHEQSQFENVSNLLKKTAGKICIKNRRENLHEIR